MLRICIVQVIGIESPKTGVFTGEDAFAELGRRAHRDLVRLSVIENYEAWARGERTDLLFCDPNESNEMAKTVARAFWDIRKAGIPHRMVKENQTTCFIALTK